MASFKGLGWKEGPPALDLEPGSEEGVCPDVGDLVEQGEDGGVLLGQGGHLGHGLAIQNQLQKQFIVSALDDLLNHRGHLRVLLGDRPPVVEQSILPVLQPGTSVKVRLLLSNKAIELF